MTLSLYGDPCRFTVNIIPGFVLLKSAADVFNYF